MAPPPHLWILYGEDDFSRHQALQGLRRSLGPREEVDANASWLSGGEVTIEQLQAIGATVPFLAAVRVVVVEGLLGRFQPRAPFRRGNRIEQAAPSLGPWQELPQLVQTFPETTALVLLDGPLWPRNPLFQALSPLAQVQRFPALKEAALAHWLQQQALRKGGRLTPEAVRLLAQLVGSNLWALDNELEKLLLFAGSRPVEASDVRALVSLAREANVFAAMDAVLERRPTLAVTLLRRLLAEGAEVSYLLIMLTRQVRLLLLTKALRARGVAPTELAKHLGGLPDYVVKRCIQQAQQVSEETLRQFLRRLLETDLATKVGQIEEELALELLVVEMSSR